MGNRTDEVCSLVKRQLPVTGYECYGVDDSDFVYVAAVEEHPPLQIASRST